jgi:DNA-binding NarL/FixJ family response regulator
MSEGVSPVLGDRLELPLKLLLIDPDPIYRTGLRVVLEKLPMLQVVAEAGTDTAALQILPELASSFSSLGVDLVLLELQLDRSQSSQSLGLQLCRQLKNQYPNLPVLLLTALQDTRALAAAKQAGVNGYCPKGIPVEELVAVMRQVATGRWGDGEMGDKKTKRQGDKETRGQGDKGTKGVISFSPSSSPSPSPSSSSSSPSSPPITPSPHHPIAPSSQATRHSPVVRLRNNLRLSGLRQIDTSLAEVTAQLQDPGLSLLDRATLAGQRRELLAARWLVNQLLPTSENRNQETRDRREMGDLRELGELKVNPSLARLPERRSGGTSLPTVHSSLFTSTRAKLQSSLENLTRVPLEIDIFREAKKRELLTLLLQKIEDLLAELRFSQVQSSQLKEINPAIMRDLWQAATTDFFGKYSTLRVGERHLDIVNNLLQDVVVVQTAILDKVPFVADLLSYLLFKTPLVIENISYAADSTEAQERAETILQNMLIQLANAVVQPLLNRFSDVEAIKQIYYDRSLISTRELERFRNELSWKYRIENSIGEPTKIFESRYELFVLASRGIANISVYAPRNQELKKLSGIQLVVTLALEIRDAIAPRLRSSVAFLGNGIVYVLTQVVGRAIGLIGRGILQGLGGSLQETKNKKF